MDRISARTWSVIGFVGFALFASYWLRWVVQRQSFAHPSAFFSYEMPRPKNFEPGFDLSDYEIERKFKKLPALADAKRPLAGAQAFDPKAAEKAKQLEGKKKTAATQKASEVAAQNKKVQVRVVDTSRAPHMEVRLTDGRPRATIGGYLNTAPVAPVQDRSAGPEEESAANERSPSQWRSLLQASPNAANIAAFISARQAGKIDQASYYSILHDLLFDTAEDRRRAGLSVLDHDISASSFEFMVLQAVQAPADVRGDLQSRIAAYSEPTKIIQIARVLANSRSETVLDSALDRAAVAWTAYRSTGLLQRSLAAQPALVGRMSQQYSLATFQGMLSSLQRIAKMNSIGSKASQLAAEIQAVVTQSKS